MHFMSLLVVCVILQTRNEVWLFHIFFIQCECITASFHVWMPWNVSYLFHIFQRALGFLEISSYFFH